MQASIRTSRPRSAHMVLLAALLALATQADAGTRTRHRPTTASAEPERAAPAVSLPTPAPTPTPTPAQPAAAQAAPAPERSAADRLAEEAKTRAEQQASRQADAAIAADVQRVLQRAKVDYPVLATPEGEPVLREIMARQQALAARGVYPSIAMVEAVADHASFLAPKAAAVAPAAGPAAIDPDVVRTGPAAGFGNCYWKTPSIWTCQ